MNLVKVEIRLVKIATEANRIADVTHGGTPDGPEVFIQLLLGFWVLQMHLSDAHVHPLSRQFPQVHSQWKLGNHRNRSNVPVLQTHQLLVN